MLKRIIPTAVWQRVATTLPLSGDPRRQWTVHSLVLCTALMGWSLETSITQRFREACETLGRLFPNRRQTGRSYQGMAKAIQAAPAAPGPAFWRVLRETFPRQIERHRLWHGWTLIAVDPPSADPPGLRPVGSRLGRGGACGGSVEGGRDEFDEF
jgi:hypothetical protein